MAARDDPPQRIRASSPRRSTAEIEEMFHSCYTAITEQAKRQREQINAISAQLKCIKADQDIIESRNLTIQAYLTQIIEANSRSSVRSATVTATFEETKP